MKVRVRPEASLGGKDLQTAELQIGLSGQENGNGVSSEFSILSKS
jgi:hypothetical protein